MLSASPGGSLKEDLFFLLCFVSLSSPSRDLLKRQRERLVAEMQTFQKPENALKRANELLAVGQQEAALKILHGAIGHRRFRYERASYTHTLSSQTHSCIDTRSIHASDAFHIYIYIYI